MKKATKSVNLRLTQEEIEIIRAHGYGCITAGIRRMITEIHKVEITYLESVEENRAVLINGFGKEVGTINISPIYKL